MVHLLIWLLILVAIVGIVWYVLQNVPLPPPLRIVVMVIVAIICIIFLLQLGGMVDGGTFRLGAVFSHGRILA